MYLSKYNMTDTSAHNTHGTGGRPFNMSGIWELPPTYIQRLIKYTVCFLACRTDEKALLDTLTTDDHARTKTTSKSRDNLCYLACASVEQSSDPKGIRIPRCRTY